MFFSSIDSGEQWAHISIPDICPENPTFVTPNFKPQADRTPPNTTSCSFKITRKFLTRRASRGNKLRDKSHFRPPPGPFPQLCTLRGLPVLRDLHSDHSIDVRAPRCPKTHSNALPSQPLLDGLAARGQ